MNNNKTQTCFLVNKQKTGISDASIYRANEEPSFLCQKMNIEKQPISTLYNHLDQSQREISEHVQPRKRGELSISHESFETMPNESLRLSSQEGPVDHSQMKRDLYFLKNLINKLERYHGRMDIEDVIQNLNMALEKMKQSYHREGGPGGSPNRDLKKFEDACDSINYLRKSYQSKIDDYDSKIMILSRQSEILSRMLRNEEEKINALIKEKNYYQQKAEEIKEV